MAYEFAQIFCATAVNQEPERAAFYELVAELNQLQAAATNLLLVPLSLTPQTTDKRLFQPAIHWNIRQCSAYLQVFDGDWGPPERNFAADYALAQQCAADPACPMQLVALLPNAPLDDFRHNLRTILRNLLATITTTQKQEVVSA